MANPKPDRGFRPLNPPQELPSKEVVPILVLSGARSSDADRSVYLLQVAASTGVVVVTE